MPAGDGTGPLGTGPIGWGLGPCGAGLRRGPGRGLSRGMRPGFGRGYRWFWRQPVGYWWPGYYGAPATPGAPAVGTWRNPAAERDWLMSMAEDLQAKLEQVEARLDELAGDKTEE